MVHVPPEIRVTVELIALQIAMVCEMNVTARPDDAVALTGNAADPYGWFGSPANEMV
jgi:hypothetical protein